MKSNTGNLKKAISIIVLAFFYNISVFSQADTPCAAPLFTLGTSCVYVTHDASGDTKSTTAIAPNPTCPNNQYTGSLAEEDTWYAFVAPAGGSVIISTARTSGSVYPYASAAVYSGACASLTEIDCFGGYGGGSYPNFTLNGLIPGNTYYVRFWGLYANGATSPKTHDFCAYAPPSPPANDECDNAIPAVVDTTSYCNQTTPGTIDGATQSSESYYCSFAGGGDANDDVWFSFVALETTQYFYLENIVGSSNDLSFSVHAGTFCNSTGVNSLACNIDFVTGLTIGSTYYVRVWSNSSAAQNSTFDLCITAPPVEPPCAENPIAGNTACTATPICNLDGYCGTTSSSYSADSWTELFNEAASCFPDIDNNSFLELTAADTAISFWVWVDNCNTPNGIQIMVFSADTCGGGPVTRHSCWSPGYVPIGATLVRASGLTIGNTYFIMIDGNAGAVCDYKVAAHEGFQTAVEINSISGDTSICVGSSIDLFATGGSGIYTWSPATWLNNTFSDTVTSTPSSLGSLTYTVTSTNSVAICPTDSADFTLVITDYVTGTDVQAACGSYTWIDGNTYSTNNNTATDTIFGGSVGGCDSIVTLDLTITNTVTSTDVQTACISYTWIDGNTYSTNNNTATDTLIGVAANGCDSIVTLDLTISGSVTSTDIQSACDSYTWIDGNTYSTNNNTATDTLFGASVGGCDSIITLDLTIYTDVFSTDVQSACGTYTWIDGNTFSNNNNTAKDTIVGGSINGCDSIVTLDLTITNDVTSTDVQTACGTYTWIDGNTYSNNNNTAKDTIVGGSINGCDSIVTLDLTITNDVTSTDVQTACGTYTWIDGNTYSNNNNTAKDTITGGASNGCDSIITLNLTITPEVNYTDVQTACNTYTWIDGNTYSSNNNTAKDTITGGASNGCDSIITLNLTINADVNFTDVQTACDTYTWIDGNTYTTNNTSATQTIASGATNGCDSIITLNLTITTDVNSIDVQTACDTYTWIDGNTYTTNNTTATHTIIGGTSNGCDSIITLNLTIATEVNSTDVQVACDSYTWIDGVTYTSSNNTSTNTLLNSSVNGCDSIITLNLTILNTPSVNPEATLDTISLGSEVTLSVVDSGYSYLWSNGVNGNFTVVSPIETMTFSVEASNGVCSDTGYIEIVVLDEELNLFLPSAFSPNGDGVNDLFRILNSADFTNIEMKIYNRWGELIFIGSDQNHEWNGTYNSKDQNIGIYVFDIEALGKNGKEYKLSGNVTLVR